MNKQQIVRSIKKNPNVKALNKKAAAIKRSTSKNVNRLKKSTKRNVNKITKSAKRSADQIRNNIPFVKQKKSNTPPIVAAALVAGIGVLAAGAYLANSLLGAALDDDFYDED